MTMTQTRIVSKVTFETATIADVIAKATRIAPNKGSSLDKFGGILIELNIYPGQPCVIRSTDGEVTFRQVVNVVDVTDQPMTWRIGTGVLPRFLAGLAPTPGSQVRLDDRMDSYLSIVSGKTKAKLALIPDPENFPAWQPFDEAALIDADGFALRLSQVAWATDSAAQGNVLSGVHITGQHLVATNRSSIAFVPCKVTLETPVTAPLSTLSYLIQRTDAIGIAATDQKLHVVPGEGIQLTSRLLEAQYPPVEQLLQRITFDTELHFDRDLISQALGRLLVLASEDRQVPCVTMAFMPDEVTLTMDVPGVGTVIEVVDVEGGDEFKLACNPQTVKRAIDSSAHSVMKMHLNIAGGPMSPIKVSDPDGYFAILSPLNPAMVSKSSV